MANVEPPTPPVADLPQGGPTTTKDERTMAMICHLLGLLVFTSIPFANVIGPLILWQIKKAESPFLDDQGKEVLNFQIAVTLAMIVSGLLICVFLVGLIPLTIVIVADVIYLIIGATKANQGEAYRYPYTWRLIK